MTVRGLRFAGRAFAVRCVADGSTEVLDAPDGFDIVIS